MKGTDIQTRLMRDLYQVWHEQGSNVIFPLREWAVEQSLDTEKVYDAFEHLAAAGLVSSLGMGVNISARGILAMEEQKLVPTEQVRENTEARFQILDALARLREEHGGRAIIDFTHVAESANLAQPSFLRNEFVLCGLGLTEWPVTRTISITYRGLERVTEGREKRERIRRFQGLTTRVDLTPQARGHEFEQLLQSTLADDGWTVETNVHAPGEEHDLIINRQLDYYLIECKWVKEAIQPHFLSVLRDRVRARVGMRGLFFSLSGFTPEAIKETQVRLSEAMILLFGPKDIEDIMAHRRTFSDMLQTKFHAAITRRAMLVDDQAHSRS